MYIIHCNFNNALLQHSLISKYACFSYQLYGRIVWHNKLAYKVTNEKHIYQLSCSAIQNWIPKHDGCADVVNKSWLATHFPLSLSSIQMDIHIIYIYMWFCLQEEMHRRRRRHFTGFLCEMLCRVLWHNMRVCRLETAAKRRQLEWNWGLVFSVFLASPQRSAKTTKQICKK